MRITKLHIKAYKNIQDFDWELNPDYPVAVIVGKNASGKSNLLEAILLIFAQIRTERIDKKFRFEVEYQDFDQNVILFKNNKNGFSSTRNGASINANRVFPKQIIAYYAGTTSRMAHIIKEYRKKRETTREFDIVYTHPAHFRFALLALFGSNLERIKDGLLKDKFGIKELISFQIKIQKPEYSLPKEANKENFWFAPISLKSFFETLIQSGTSQNSGNDYTIDFDKKALERLMESLIIGITNERQLFEYLSESFEGGFIKTVEINLKKTDIVNPINYKDLSEGEKQRIGMRGTIELFLGSETLFLLDEPDSFAHPRWQWQFVPDLQETLGDSRSLQVIFVTHSPLVLSTVRDNAFMMEGGQIQELNDLYGMDVDTVLIDGMETSVRPPQVVEDFESYFIFIESGRGESDEAKKKRQDLERIYPLNHPSFSKADMLRSLYI